MKVTKVIKMIRDGESLAFDYLSNKRCGILPMAGTLDRLQEIVTCLEGMDMQDIIAELSRLNQRQVRNLVLPLMYRHDGEDYDMPFDDVEALICKLDRLHDRLVFDITVACGFTDFDDLFPVADKVMGSDTTPILRAMLGDQTDKFIAFCKTWGSNPDKARLLLQLAGVKDISRETDYTLVDVFKELQQVGVFDYKYTRQAFSAAMMAYKPKGSRQQNITLEAYRKFS